MRRFAILTPLALASLLSAGQGSPADQGTGQPGTKQSKPTQRKQKKHKTTTAPNTGDANRSAPPNQLPDGHQNTAPNTAPIPAPNDTVPTPNQPERQPNPGNPNDPTSPTVTKPPR